jgi:hypothetical protein
MDLGVIGMLVVRSDFLPDVRRRLDNERAESGAVAPESDHDLIGEGRNDERAKHDVFPPALRENAADRDMIIIVFPDIAPEIVSQLCWMRGTSEREAEQENVNGLHHLTRIR